MQQDYIIIGGGTAGCVLANRLSENGKHKVILLEAGGTGDSWIVKAPIGIIPQVSKGVNNWNFQTVPQKHLNGRKGFQPRGKSLGGSSAINAMVYIRGHRSDYNHWESLGNKGWGWADVLPIFKRSENNEEIHDEFHGQGGKLNVSNLKTDSPFHEVFQKAAIEAQFPLNSDFNGAHQQGLGQYQVTQKNGERFSVARAYLHPIMSNRNNLTVITGAVAQKILFEGKKAVAVTYKHKGNFFTLKASKEIIVCLGAFQSPQLLKVSGIGSSEELSKHNIPVVHELRGVGENLQDHIDFTFNYTSNDTRLFGTTFKGLANIIKSIFTFRKTGRGLMTSNFAESGGFLKTDPNLPVPDIQVHFVHGIVDDHARKMHFSHGFSVHTCLLRPASRGSVNLASSSMDDNPLIDPNFLSDPKDVENMLAAYKTAKRLCDTPSLQALANEELYTKNVKSDDDIRAILREKCDTIYHPVGTCKMGVDEMAVVSPELKVYGVENLRVVDASIMPTLIGGNTNAPTVMIAEKAADMILLNS